MSYNTDLQNNNNDLRSILNAVNELPDAGGGGGECNCSEWEIINEIVTTEEVTGVTISTDSDGNAFDLLEGKAFIVAPEALPNEAWYLYSSPGAENYVMLASESVNYIFFEYSKLDSLIRVGSRSTKIGTSGIGVNKAGSPIFNRFRFLNWGGAKIPVGTTIRLIGRRA